MVAQADHLHHRPVVGGQGTKLREHVCFRAPPVQPKPVLHPDRAGYGSSHQILDAAPPECSQHLGLVFSGSADMPVAERRVVLQLCERATLRWLGGLSGLGGLGGLAGHAGDLSRGAWTLVGSDPRLPDAGGARWSPPLSSMPESFGAPGICPE